MRIEYVDLTPEEFEEKVSGYQSRVADLFAESHTLEQAITEKLQGLTRG